MSGRLGPLLFAACSMLLPVFAVVTGASRADAVERSFGPFRYDDANPGIILLDGSIGSGSALDFRRVLAAAPQANLLALNSPGGMVSMALLIADDVDQRRMSTFIPADAECYSACSFIFFAGATRRVNGRLGVHQISQDSPDLVSAQLAISDIIDILTRFGTPADVLTIMFRTRPDDMHVFSPAEIAALGIQRDAGAAAAIAPMPAPAQSFPTDPLAAAPQERAPAADDSTARAERFLDAYLAAWSSPNAAALDFMDATYADELTFYGKSTSHRAVMAEKRKFAERWPERRYSAQPGSVRIDCAVHSCSIDAVVDWYAHSDARGKTSRGMAEFSLLWSPLTGRIYKEGGRVLKSP